MTDIFRPIVAVIGAGPAGLYAAKHLADNDCHVIILNRDIKPGGLAEYGIFFDKYKMKSGLRKQFKGILALPNVHYFGNVRVGTDGDLTLAQIRDMADAVLVTVGAQGTKWLGTPGEDLPRVYHAKDVVYHYNHLPPWSERDYPFGKRVAIIGAGNVMLDIANYAIRYLKVDEVVAIVRRDPSAVKFTKKELSYVFENLDQDALTAEIERTRPIMEAVGKSPEDALAFIQSAGKRAKEPVSDTKLRFEFLATTKQIEGNATDGVTAITVEDNTLQLRDDGVATRSVGLGTTRTIPVDTVVFAIGDQVDSSFGLPTNKWGEFEKHPSPQFDADGVSYEAYDPAAEAAIDGVFLAGWARQASTGLVGAARKDGVTAADTVLRYLETVEPTAALDAITTAITATHATVVTKAQVAQLEMVEEARATEDDLPEFKFDHNDDMLAVVAPVAQ